MHPVRTRGWTRRFVSIVLLIQCHSNQYAVVAMTDWMVFHVFLCFSDSFDVFSDFFDVFFFVLFLSCR